LSVDSQLPVVLLSIVTELTYVLVSVVGCIRLVDCLALQQSLSNCMSIDERLYKGSPSILSISVHWCLRR